MPLVELVQHFTLPSNFWRSIVIFNADLIDNMLAVDKCEKSSLEQSNKTSGWLMGAFQAWLGRACEAKKEMTENKRTMGHKLWQAIFWRK